MVAQVDSTYMSYGLGRYLCRLFSYALFEGRPLTTKGRWFNPVVFAWLRLLATLPGEPTLDRPIFITGLGRSGTTILGVLLSLHREVGFLNEPKAAWTLIEPRHDINGNYLPASGVFRLGTEDVTRRSILISRRLFGRYLVLTGSRRLVDKYPELIFRVNYVKALFPDARIIFITRNGVDATQSIVNWSRHLGVHVARHLEDWWGHDDIKWNYLREQLILADPQYASVHAVATSDLDHTNRAALEWIVTMREGIEQVKQHPDIISIRYEDLISQPKQELERLQMACGLQPDPKVTDYAGRMIYENPGKFWPELNPLVEQLFIETMAKLGYGDVLRVHQKELD